MAEEIEAEPKVSEIDDQSQTATGEPNATVEPSEFAFRLVNVVKAMNSGEISYHEVATSFSLAVTTLLGFLKKWTTNTNTIKEAICINVLSQFISDRPIK